MKDLMKQKFIFLFIPSVSRSTFLYLFFWYQRTNPGFVIMLIFDYVTLETQPYYALRNSFNPLNAELNPICYLLALLGAHHFLHFSRIRVKSLTLRLLMPYIYIYVCVCIYIYIYIYIYGTPILDVSRSYTTTQHSR